MSRVFRAQNRAPRTSQVSKRRDGQGGVSDPAELLADARRVAAEVLASSRIEATSLLESARTESAVLREQAAEEGYCDGRGRGYEAGLAEASDLVSQAQSALDQALEAFDSMLRESEPRLLALALSTAKRVASESLKTDPNVALDLIRKGMAALRDEREFSLRVDPDLVSVLMGARDDLGREFGARSLEVVPDAAAADGVLVHTPHGFVDATVASQIRNIASALAEARKRAVEGEQ